MKTQHSSQPEVEEGKFASPPASHNKENIDASRIARSKEASVTKIAENKSSSGSKNSNNKRQDPFSSAQKRTPTSDGTSNKRPKTHLSSPFSKEEAFLAMDNTGLLNELPNEASTLCVVASLFPSVFFHFLGSHSQITLQFDHQ